MVRNDIVMSNDICLTVAKISVKGSISCCWKNYFQHCLGVGKKNLLGKLLVLCTMLTKQNSAFLAMSMHVWHCSPTFHSLCLTWERFPFPRSLWIPLSFLNKHSFLREKSRRLKTGTKIQRRKFPSRKVGDEFESFVGITFLLNHQNEIL